MYTLQEFIRFTKGWEYIIAIVAVFAFVGFWRLVSGTSSPKKGRKEEDEVAR